MSFSVFVDFRHNKRTKSKICTEIVKLSYKPHLPFENENWINLIIAGNPVFMWNYTCTANGKACLLLRPFSVADVSYISMSAKYGIIALRRAAKT